MFVSLLDCPHHFLPLSSSDGRTNQVWNCNTIANDNLIAEANIPLHSWLELCRRRYDPDNPETWVNRLENEWVAMRHPFNEEDKGDVELTLELLPKDVAADDQYMAARGFQGFEERGLNSAGPVEGSELEKDKNPNLRDRLLAAPKRPDSSFPWWRLDLQCIWRVK